jgi:hypothetical protein
LGLYFRAVTATATTATETASLEEVVVADEAAVREPPWYAVVGVFALLSVWLTFRHVTQIGTAIPGTPGDSLLNLWIMTHVQDSVFRGWHALWDTPTFYPAEGTLAYSESLFAVALVDWPFRLLFGPIVAYNLMHIGASVLAAWAVYRLAIRYTRLWGAAFVGALVYTFAATRVTDVAHFQIVVGGALVPVVLLALLRCLDAPTTGRAVLLGLALAAVTLTASYDAALSLVLVVVVTTGWLLRQRPLEWRPYARAAAISVALVAAVVGPFAYMYLHLQQQEEFQRAFKPVMALRPRDLFAASRRSLGSQLPGLGHLLHPTGHLVFPGLVGLAGAVLGAIVLLRRPADELAVRRRRELLLVALAGAILLVLAFGDWQTIAGRRIPLPYQLLRNVPGFSELRALSRLALGTQLAVALLTAVGLDAFVLRRAPSWRIPATIALAGIVCAEGFAGIGLTAVPTAADDYGIDRVLRAHPSGVVLELPMQSAGHGAQFWAYVEMPRQFVALRDEDPRVNGYSGFQPARFDNLATLLNRFPSPDALRQARRLGVRYVVLRTRFVGDAPPSVRFVLRNGAGNYTDATASRMIRDLPKGSARSVKRAPGGYVIELAGNGE